MITEEIVEAMDLMIDLCMDGSQEKGMTLMRDMLCDLDADAWGKMSASEKIAWMKAQLNQNSKRSVRFGVRYTDQSGIEEVNYFRSEDAAEKHIRDELNIVRDNFDVSEIFDTETKVEIDEVGSDRWSVWERTWR